MRYFKWYPSGPLCREQPHLGVKVSWETNEPIQAPHHERVPCTHDILDLPQPRSLCHGTANPVDNDPCATHLLQGVLLEVEILIVCGDACVSDVHRGPVKKENNSSGSKCILTLFSYCVYYRNLGAQATENRK